MAYPFTTQAFARPYNALIKVSGIEGARAYQMPPDSAIPLFHATEDVLYIKTTDGAGFPSIRQFRFEEIDPQPSNADYVKRDEFEELKGAIANVEQLVREQGEWSAGEHRAVVTGQPASGVRPDDGWQSSIPVVHQGQHGKVSTADSGGERA